MANYTILLIDYEPRSIERFRQPLAEAGYTIEIATDGLSGIDAFHRLSPDMVLVEAMIPKKHGFEVCQELKRSPHGRRTPILITTGVYKGRKYRTQALHIYGCDEYIEKPIAPEQLLAIVGRFLGPSASPSPTRTTVAEAAESTPRDAIAEAEGGAKAEIAPSAAPSTPNTPRRNPKSLPSAVAEDLTDEDEIMARLDAVLSSGSNTTPAVATSLTFAAVSAAEPFEAIPIEFESTSDQDPFAQMRAELSAELGSLAAALALEPAPALEPIPDAIPSDQSTSPSVFEALPPCDVMNHVGLDASVTGGVADSPSGQLVSFDTSRPRKGKKSVRRSKERAPRVVETPDVRESKLSSAVELAPAVSEVTLPPGTLVESVLEPTARKPALSAWLWAAAGVAAIVIVYLVFSRGGWIRSDASPLPTSRNTNQASASAPISPPIPGPSSAPADGANLVLNAIRAPTPARPLVRAAPPRPAKAAASPPVVANAEPKVADDPPPNQEPPRPPEPVAAAPSGLDEIVTGVESVASPGAALVPPSIAPGTLVSLDEVDAPPVALSRGLPTYSKLARDRRISGTVVMNVLINEDGTVNEVVLVTGVSGADVNDSAIRAAKSWTYHPATKGGVPVKVWKTEQVVFKL